MSIIVNSHNFKGHSKIFSNRDEHRGRETDVFEQLLYTIVPNIVVNGSLSNLVNVNLNSICHSNIRYRAISTPVARKRSLSEGSCATGGRETDHPTENCLCRNYTTIRDIYNTPQVELLSQRVCIQHDLLNIATYV